MSYQKLIFPIDDVQIDIKINEEEMTVWLSKEDLATYAAMGLILIAAIVLVYIFLDKQGANPFKKTTTTSTPVHTIETTQEQYIEPKTITTTTTTTKSANVQGTTNIDAGADRVEPTTFHTVQTTN